MRVRSLISLSTCGMVFGAFMLKAPAAAPEDAMRSVLVRLLTEKPPTRAWLEVTDLSNHVPLPTVTTYAGGDGVRLTLPSGNSIVCAGAEGLASDCRVAPADSAASLALTPTSGREVVGRVRLGRAFVRGARVRVVLPELQARRAFYWPLRQEAGLLIRETATDHDGRFKISRLPLGRVEFETSVPSGRVYRSRVFTIAPPNEPSPSTGQGAAEGPQSVGVLQFDEGVSTRVSVVDSDGQGVPKARVGATQRSRDEKPVLVETLADAMGQAVLAGLEFGAPISVSCLAEGRLPETIDLPVPPPTLQVQLKRPSGVRGIVVTEEGEPVSGAQVALGGRTARVLSHQDGVFEFSGLRDGETELRVVAPGFRTTRLPLALELERSTDVGNVQLTRGATRRGRVVDASTSDPVVGASVAIEDPTGAGATSTDGDGVFEFQTDPGRLVVQVQASGYAGARNVIDGKDGVLDRLTVIRLHRGGRLLIRATSSYGDDPCVGCAFTISSDVSPWFGLTTGSNGEATSDDLAPGRYLVQRESARSVGSAVFVHGGEETKAAEIRDGETAIVDFSEAVETFVARLSQGVGSAELAFDDGEGRRFASRAGVGTFTFRRHRGRRVALALESPEFSVPIATVQADASPGEIGISVPETLVRGRFRCPKGRFPTQLIRLRHLVEGSGSGWFLSGEDGEFAVPYLAPGLYIVNAEGSTGTALQVRASASQNVGDLTLISTSCEP